MSINPAPRHTDHVLTVHLAFRCGLALSSEQRSQSASGAEASQPAVYGGVARMTLAIPHCPTTLSPLQKLHVRPPSAGPRAMVDTSRRTSPLGDCVEFIELRPSVPEVYASAQDPPGARVLLVGSCMHLG